MSQKYTHTLPIIKSFFFIIVFPFFSLKNKTRNTYEMMFDNPNPNLVEKTAQKQGP